MVISVSKVQAKKERTAAFILCREATERGPLEMTVIAGLEKTESSKTGVISWHPTLGASSEITLAIRSRSRRYAEIVPAARLSAAIREQNCSMVLVNPLGRAGFVIVFILFLVAAHGGTLGQR